MRNLAIVILLVWALVASVLLFNRSRPVDPAPAPVALFPPPAPDVPPPPAVDVAPLNAKIAAMTDEIARLKKDLLEARMQASKPAAQKPVSVASPGAGPQLDLGQVIANALKQSGLGNPAGDAQRQRRIYGPLLAKLGLDEAKRDAFFRALSTSPRRFGLPGEQAENKALKDLLGESAYAQWQEYGRTVAHRGAVDDFEQRLLGSGLPLNDVQRTSLVDAFAKSGLGAPNVVELSLTPGQEGPQNLTGALDQKFNDWDSLVADAKTYLSPAQMKELDGYLGERAAQHEELAKMANVSIGSIGGTESIEGLVPGIAVSNVSVKIISSTAVFTNLPGQGVFVPASP